MGEKSFPILMQITLHENHIFQNFTDWHISITDHLQGKFLHYTLQRKHNRRVDGRFLFSQQNPMAIVVLIVETINLPLCCCRAVTKISSCRVYWVYAISRRGMVPPMQHFDFFEHGQIHKKLDRIFYLGLHLIFVMRWQVRYLNKQNSLYCDPRSYFN